MDIVEYFETIFKAELEEPTENNMTVSVQIDFNPYRVLHKSPKVN